MGSWRRLIRAVLAEDAPGVALDQEPRREDQHDQADQDPVSAGCAALAVAGRPGRGLPGPVGPAWSGPAWSGPAWSGQGGTARAKRHRSFRNEATWRARAEYG